MTKIKLLVLALFFAVNSVSVLAVNEFAQTDEEKELEARVNEQEARKVLLKGLVNLKSFMSKDVSFAQRFDHLEIQDRELERRFEALPFTCLIALLGGVAIATEPGLLTLKGIKSLVGSYGLLIVGGGSIYSYNTLRIKNEKKALENEIASFTNEALKKDIDDLGFVFGWNPEQKRTFKDGLIRYLAMSSNSTNSSETVGLVVRRVINNYSLATKDQLQMLESLTLAFKNSGSEDQYADYVKHLSSLAPEELQKEKSKALVWLRDVVKSFADDASSSEQLKMDAKKFLVEIESVLEKLK